MKERKSYIRQTLEFYLFYKYTISDQKLRKCIMYLYCTTSIVTFYKPHTFFINVRTTNNFKKKIIYLV